MRSAIVVLAMLLFSSIAVTAQSATPVPSRLFPAAEELGPGWVQHAVFDLPLDQYPSFARFAVAAYLGPNGSRIVVVYSESADGARATSEVWAEANRMIDDWGKSIDFEEAVQEKLSAISPVTGCTDMRRMRGEDPVIPSVLVSMSLCGVNTDTFVLAYVSGSLQGVSGYRASDRIVKMVLRASEAQ
jgi:hypothetical protein